MQGEEEIKAVWSEFHVERARGADMTNECRLAAAILKLRAQLAEKTPPPGVAETLRREAGAIRYNLSLEAVGGGTLCTLHGSDPTQNAHELVEWVERAVGPAIEP